MHNTGFSNCDG